jgi:hypothetical protein
MWQYWIGGNAMKMKYVATIMAVIMLFALMGCSRKANQPGNSAEPTGSPQVSDSGNSADRNDAFDGGGAGGTEGSGNDASQGGSPDATPHVSDNGVLGDIGDGVGDLIDGAGNAIQDAGDAIGDAANQAGDAMK